MTGEGSARRLYVDTSAWLAGLLAEAGGADVSREVRGAQLLSSVLLVVEVNRNLVRLAREGKLTPAQLQLAMARFEQDLDTFELMDLTLDVARDRAMPSVVTPRSLDLVHLRCALRFHHEAPLTRFVSLDQAQNEAARDLGLPT
ncbi:MAG: type II toxin-antitoxin system VapC family toxin [Deltaproteobacteria bacterium]|nr:type II toxin-antitoxin system VapC family toxin [Deltaproteobacteria bacterium]